MAGLGNYQRTVAADRARISPTLGAELRGAGYVNLNLEIDAGHETSRRPIISDIAAARSGGAVILNSDTVVFARGVGSTVQRNWFPSSRIRDRVGSR